MEKMAAAAWIVWIVWTDVVFIKTKLVMSLSLASLLRLSPNGLLTGQFLTCCYRCRRRPLVVIDDKAYLFDMKLPQNLGHMTSQATKKSTTGLENIVCGPELESTLKNACATNLRSLLVISVKSGLTLGRLVAVRHPSAYWDNFLPNDLR